MQFLFLLFFLFFSHFAEEESFDFEDSHSCEKVLDQRENYFQTSTPQKIIPNVNPITGDLIEEEVDPVVAGSDPLTLRRFFNHLGQYERRTGGWRYNPEFFSVTNFAWPGQEIFAAVGEASCNIIPLKPTEGQCIFDSQGFTHFTPSGQNHPLNTKINYTRDPP